MGVGCCAQPAALRRVGLLGGSFDPVHNAHLALAAAALQHLALDAMEFLPAAAPWQRQPLGASSAQRVRMLELAIAGLDKASVNTVEVERGGPTYTIDTLRALGAGDTAGTEYFWVLGSDQLANFCTWHEWREIVKRVRLAVATRPGSRLDTTPELAQELALLGHQLYTLPFAPTDLSASEIRQKLAVKQAIDGLTPPSVVDYIKTNHLYQA